MKIVAVPILDSQDATWATQQLVPLYRQTHARIHLVNVQPAFPSHIARFFDAATLARIHREDGLQFLEPIARALNKARIPHRDHVLVGRKAEKIAEFVTSYSCSDVLIRNESESLLRLGLASINSGVRRTLRSLSPELVRNVRS